MSALPSDLIAMKDSPTYMPILRSVLKSQIQFLVDQLSNAGEETLLLSANISDGLVDQLGSESGKMFANVYDDFKSEFLEFCQKRRGKRKPESPQKVHGEVKKVKPFPAVLALPKANVALQKVQAVKSTSNVPKVSSARIVMNQKAAASTPESQYIQIAAGQSDMEVLSESEEGYGEIEDTGLEYDELEDVEDWQGESVESPSSSEVQSSSSKVTTPTVVPKENTATQNPNMVITSTGNMKTIRFEKSLLIKNSCSYCNKVFGSQRDMKLHMRSHTGEKPYKCEFCGQMFTLKRSAEKHILKQHQLNVVIENM